MYKKEKKIWSIFGKSGKYMFIGALGACVICSFFSLGSFALAFGCTSLTGLVLKAGSNYVLETIAFCENQEKVIIPDEMKCNGSDYVDEDMENVKIYTVSPSDIGLEKRYSTEESILELQDCVSIPTNGPALKRKM